MQRSVADSDWEIMTRVVTGAFRWLAVHCTADTQELFLHWCAGLSRVSLVPADTTITSLVEQLGRVFQNPEHVSCLGITYKAHKYPASGPQVAKLCEQLAACNPGLACSLRHLSINLGHRGTIIIPPTESSFSNVVVVNLVAGQLDVLDFRLFRNKLEEWRISDAKPLRSRILYLNTRGLEGLRRLVLNNVTLTADLRQLTCSLVVNRAESVTPTPVAAHNLAIVTELSLQVTGNMSITKWHESGSPLQHLTVVKLACDRLRLSIPAMLANLEELVIVAGSLEIDF